MCYMGYNEVWAEFYGTRWYLNWILKGEKNIYRTKGKRRKSHFRLTDWGDEQSMQSILGQKKSILKIIGAFWLFSLF